MINLSKDKFILIINYKFLELKIKENKLFYNILFILNLIIIIIFKLKNLN